MCIWTFNLFTFFILFIFRYVGVLNRFVGYFFRLFIFGCFWVLDLFRGFFFILFIFRCVGVLNLLWRFFLCVFVIKCVEFLIIFRCLLRDFFLFEGLCRFLLFISYAACRCITNNI